MELKQTLIQVGWKVLRKTKLDADIQPDIPGEFIMVRLIRLLMYAVMIVAALLFLILVGPDLFGQAPSPQGSSSSTQPAPTRNIPNPYRRIDTWAQYSLQMDAEHVRLVEEVKRLREKLEDHIESDRKDFEKTTVDRENITLLKDRFNTLVYIVGTICFAAVGQLIAYIFQIRLRREMIMERGRNSSRKAS